MPYPQSDAEPNLGSTLCGEMVLEGHLGRQGNDLLYHVPEEITVSSPAPLAVRTIGQPKNCSSASARELCQQKPSAIHTNPSAHKRHALYTRHFPRKHTVG